VQRRYVTSTLVLDSGTVSDTEFTGIGLAVPAVKIVGGRGVRVVNCRFVNCYTSVVISGGEDHVLSDCHSYWDHQPTAAESQYGFYAGGGTNLTFRNCKAHNHRLDGLKIALGVKGYHVLHGNYSYNGVPPGVAGVTSQAGDGIDTYSSGWEGSVIGVTCQYNYGNGFVAKTHVALNADTNNKVGRTRIVGCLFADNAGSGAAIEAIDSDYAPYQAEGDGTRDLARYFLLSACQLLDNGRLGGVSFGGYGLVIGGLNVTASACQITGNETEGLWIMRKARDIGIYSCDIQDNGDPPLISGAQDVRIVGGYFDEEPVVQAHVGAVTGTTYTPLNITKDGVSIVG
jgi:hypothetical protein